MIWSEPDPTALKPNAARQGGDMPPQPWKTLSTREVYQNKWMRLREDVAELPNGHTTIYGVCEFGECVGV
jgi:hypothetical protein